MTLPEKVTDSDSQRCKSQAQEKVAVDTGHYVVGDDTPSAGKPLELPRRKGFPNVQDSEYQKPQRSAPDTVRQEGDGHQITDAFIDDYPAGVRTPLPGHSVRRIHPDNEGEREDDQPVDHPERGEEKIVNYGNQCTTRRTGCDGSIPGEQKSSDQLGQTGDSPFIRLAKVELAAHEVMESRQQG